MDLTQNFILVLALLVIALLRLSRVVDVVEALPAFRAPNTFERRAEDLAVLVDTFLVVAMPTR